MTSPNLPIGSSNIPQGAFTPGSLAHVLQDYTAGKYRGTVGGRFPSIVGATPAGSPLSAISPVGIITGILSEFMKVVSNSTSHDISHPADLDDLIHDFFEGLPLVGQFVDLLDAIFGTYTGNDPVLIEIKALFQFLRPDGKIDAGKLFGELPQHMLALISALVSKFTGGLIELGQLKRPEPGQEKNWLESFDKPESVPTGDGFEHDATVGRTRLGSAKLTFDGAEHVRTSDPIEVAPGQKLDLGGYVRFDGYTGTGAAAVGLRVLAYNAGDQLIGSQVIGTVTPSGPTSSNFETAMTAQWTTPANTAYVYVRMEGYAAGTAGTAHFDDLWLRMPAQTLPQQWVEGLTGALSNLGQGVTDAWNFVQSVIDKFMNGRGILGSLFSLGHFETEVAKVFGTDSAIPQGNIDGLGGALAALLPKADWTKLLSGFTAAGGGTAPSTGIPALDGMINAFLGVRTKAVTAQTAADSAKSDLGDVITGIFNGWFGSGGTGSTAQAQQTIEAIKTAVLNGWTVQTVTSTATWTRPAGLTDCVAVLVGSGKNGANGNSYNDIAIGGLGGGFIAQSLDINSIPSSLTITVGTNGAVTSFGSLVSTTPGNGGIANEFGYAATSSLPGNGGNGGRGYFYNQGTSTPAPGSAGTVGGASALGAGGTAGGYSSGSAGGAGGAGGAVSAGTPTKSGGGGGGGGAGGSNSAGDSSSPGIGNTGRNGGNGGNGGYPGGGGGAGGGGGWGGYGSGSNGTGGTGAQGVAWIFTKVA
ncbi:hypothetical protein [Tsukamurella sputi]|uniref:hypothetical protein n=1 Tax=Tsukamurella sputi TaxID=2591848 RepID=UPI00131597D4|nr:hypothetical protein [Tsukamurella sputi]